MTRAYAFAALAVVTMAVLLYSHVVRPPAATPEECEELLHAQHVSEVELHNFIERADFDLRKRKARFTPVQAERLGLCTGALKRKAG